ncbi:MAG: PAS domain S-box protein [Lentimicrobium sp.]|jgi:PAS domain S-box-containing protein|nr:PAS domain S-box protein [Lentimicrobium sp.]
MKSTNSDPRASVLRKKALELLKDKTAKNKPTLTLSETLKLIHELEVHQIELELQNEELVIARTEALEAGARATQLYDFAPIGYFTLSREGIIIKANLQGARLLGKERTYLNKSKFGFFILNSYKNIFNQFLEKVFESKIKETCEIELSNGKDPVCYAHLSGVCSEDEDQCFLTVTDITAQKQMLELLRESEEKYRIIFENVQDVFYQTDISGKILEVSPSIKYFSGFNKKELIGSQVSELYYNPDDREVLLDLITKNSELKDFELRLKNKEGEVLYTSINARLILDKDGKPHHIDGSIRDITDRKNHEIEITEKELQYRNLANAGIALIWKSGTDKLCNYFNEPWFKFTGRTLEQEIGNGWAEGVHPEDMEYCLKIFNEAFDKQESFDMEYRLKKANGDYAWIKDMGTPNFNSEGTFIGYIGHCFDVTKRKRSEMVQQILYNIALSVVKLTSCEQLLKVIQHELNQILDTTNFFAALYNPDTEKLRKLHWADTKDDFTEWDARNSLSGQIVKTGKTMLLNRNEIEQFSEKNILTLLGTPAECWLGVPIKSDKETIGVMVIQSYEDKNAYDEESSTILELVANNLSIFLNKLKIYRDLNVAKEKAEESDRLKSAFLANMSHEIRTPMNGILGFTQLLKEPQLTGDEQIEYIGLIEKSGDRMLNIINDIVDISKIEAGLMTVHYSETKINDQIKFLFHFFKPEVEEKEIHFSYNTSLTDLESVILTDREKVYSVLTNLIKNAIKFTHEGFINIGCIRKDNFLEFTVKDSGVGVDIEKQKIIFERFRQGSELPTRNYEGAGLGLSISKAFVEMLGGRIWIKSSKGSGSEFTFTIPYKTPEKSISVAEPQESQEEQLLSNLKILIADDDSVSTMLLTLILEDFCDKILVAKTGTEAVEMVRNNHDLDLILMDIKMPEMDGYEATKIIRQFNNSIIIIAQTAYGMMYDREKALETGCNDHISRVC